MHRPLARLSCNTTDVSMGKQHLQSMCGNTTHTPGIATGSVRTLQCRVERYWSEVRTGGLEKMGAVRLTLRLVVNSGHLRCPMARIFQNSFTESCEAFCTILLFTLQLLHRCFFQLTDPPGERTPLGNLSLEPCKVNSVVTCGHIAP